MNALLSKLIVCILANISLDLAILIPCFVFLKDFKSD